MVVNLFSQMVFALGCLLQWIVRLSESRDYSGNSWHLGVRWDIMGYRKGEYNIWDGSVGISLGSRLINSELRRRVAYSD